MNHIWKCNSICTSVKPASSISKTTTTTQRPAVSQESKLQINIQVQCFFYCSTFGVRNPRQNWLLRGERGLVSRNIHSPWRLNQELLVSAQSSYRPGVAWQSSILKAVLMDLQSIPLSFSMEMSNGGFVPTRRLFPLRSHIPLCRVENVRFLVAVLTLSRWTNPEGDRERNRLQGCSTYESEFMLAFDLTNKKQQCLRMLFFKEHKVWMGIWKVCPPKRTKHFHHPSSVKGTFASLISLLTMS